MKLFAALRKMREFERLQLPFIRFLIDLDIIIEIGFAQENKKPLTPKPLFLLSLGSITTVRRRLAMLTAQGVVIRRTNPSDHRSHILSISPSSLKSLTRYGGLLTAFAVEAA